MSVGFLFQEKGIERHKNLYFVQFTPKEDITAYQLSKIMILYSGKNLDNIMEVTKEWWNKKIDDEIKIHFSILETIEKK